MSSLCCAPVPGSVGRAAWCRLRSPQGVRGPWGTAWLSHRGGITLPELKSSPSPLLSAARPYPGRCCLGENLCCGRILATPAEFSRADEAIAARRVRRRSGGCDGTPGTGTAGGSPERGRGGSPNFWGWWWLSPTACPPARHGGTEPAFSGPSAGPTNQLLSPPRLVAHAFPIPSESAGGVRTSGAAAGWWWESRGWRQGAGRPSTGRRAAFWQLLPAACGCWPCPQCGPLPGRPPSRIPSRQACSIPAGC